MHFSWAQPDGVSPFAHAAADGGRSCPESVERSEAGVAVCEGRIGYEVWAHITGCFEESIVG